MDYNALGLSGYPTRGEFESWEERLSLRRHQGSHITPYHRDSQIGPARQGFYSFNNGGMRGEIKYSRSFNSLYDGPTKGTN